MLPHQAPLYSAFDALQQNDLKEVESRIQEFFVALESDLIAIDCRQQHFERQVFEADFVSILTREEIDAWWVLSAVKMQRRDWEGALADCHRQIELIDQHYGFASPSWKHPETRIPHDGGVFGALDKQLHLVLNAHPSCGGRSLKHEKKETDINVARGVIESLLACLRAHPCLL